MADIFNIAGEINSTSQEGTAVHANQVKDDLQNKKQSQINEEVGEELELHTNRLNALTDQNYTTVQATQSTTAADIPTLINGTGEGEQTDTLYRVGFWDGSAYVADKYTEYAWNGTAYVILDVKSSIGEVFDISQYNAVGGTPTTYADLTAALSGTNVPTSVHRGGMSIKFVQSYDNKYVQYRYLLDDATTTATFTNTDNWSICDDSVLVEHPEFVYVIRDLSKHFILGIRKDYSIEWAVGVPKPVRVYVESLIAKILNGNEGTAIDGLNKVVAFLNGLSTSDTLTALLNGKVDKEDGESLIPSQYIQEVSHPEYINMQTDSNGRVLGSKRENGREELPGGLDVKNGLSVDYNKITLESNPEFLYLIKSANGRIIEGCKKNGDGFCGFGVSTQIKQYIEKIRSKTNKKVVVFAASNSSGYDKSIADIVCTGSDDNQLINGYTNRPYHIILLAGQYNFNASWIYLSGNDITIEGVGSVTLNRNNGTVISDKTSVSGILIKNISTNGYINLFTQNSSNNNSVINVSDKYGTFKQYTYCGGSNVISVGKGKDIEDLTKAISLCSRLFDSSNIYSPNCMELHIYGHIIVERSEAINIFRNINFIGKTQDAELEIILSSLANGVNFYDTNMYGELDVTCKDLKFTVSGQFSGYQQAAVQVQSNGVKFYNCTFNNKSYSGDSYDPAEDNTLLLSGDRRHGILIEITKNKHDSECKTEFYGCKGIGSPYGFKNTRGWYIKKGSPKLYDCIGYGGGVGINGHGIICHHASKPYLFNCVAYASPYGYRNCNGFQFQAAAEPTLINCVGIGGTGYQHISNGGESIVKQNTLTEASHGICMVMSVHPKLINCIGYAGDGEDSCAIVSSNLASGEVVGGYYGKELRMYTRKITAADEGSTFVTLADFPNDNRDLYLERMYVRDKTANVAKIIFKISGGTTIGTVTFGSAEGTVTLNTNIISSSDTIEVHTYDSSDNELTSAFNFELFVRYYVNNTMSYIKMEDDSSPKVSKATFVGNLETDGVLVNTTSDDYLVKDCTFDIPSGKYAVKCDTQKQNVRIVGCSFTSDLTDNVGSFKSVDSLGTNSVI